MSAQRAPWTLAGVASRTAYLRRLIIVPACVSNADPYPVGMQSFNLRIQATTSTCANVGSGLAADPLGREPPG